jgi:hypothetical protein
VARELLAEVEALRERMPLEDLQVHAGSICAIHEGAPSEHLRLYGLDWADSWMHLEPWTDPAFVPIASSDANHVGLFAHPVALARGETAPVVFRFHEHDPIFAWVAESAAHFVRMVDAAARGEDFEALRGEPAPEATALMAATQQEEAFEDLERGDVHALFWSGARVLELAAAERLETRYADRGWAFPRASIEAQRLLATYQDLIDAAWAKLR